MTDKPLVSAVVPTHNRLKLLPRALDSVAVQSYPNIELVVVDDGSESSAKPIAEQYMEVIPVTYIRNDQAAGAAKARNKGIQEASGTFVAGLDDDDQWNKYRIERLMQAYEEDYSFVTSDVRMVYQNKTSVWHKKKKIELDDLLYSNYVGNQGLIKRKRLLAVGGFNESLKAAQDYDLWIRLCETFGPVRNVRQPLQDIHMDHEGKRITEQSSFEGYLQFYNKHKHRFNRSQRKYQLLNIRKAQGKKTGLAEMLQWAPAFRYWKEIKGMIFDKMG